jgi:N-acyl-D-amino-acid deacylase
MLRKALLCTLVGLVAAGGAVSVAAAPDRRDRDDFSGADEALPTTGEAGPGLEHFDGLMRRTMDRFGVPGAALAIARDGRLVLAKGYGWADVEAEEPVLPRSLLALASVSKPITAVTVLKLVEEGKLGLDDRAFELLGPLRPPPGEQMDPRIRDITVRMLLNHSGGWDRRKSGDPSGFGPRVARRLHVREPVSAVQLTRFMLGQPLDFDPGTEERYSNFGYVVLGLVIERVTGESYEEYVQEHTLRPMGIRRMRLDGLPPRYERGEVRRYSPGADHLFPGGHGPMTDAAGGWLASAPDMARFLTALDGSRGEPFLSEDMTRTMLTPPPPPLKPRKDGSYFGLGWDRVRRTEDGFGYAKNGGLHGVSTWIEHLPGGVDWVLLVNTGVEHSEVPMMATFEKEVRRAIAEVKEWPEIDLFRQPP